mgnify:CR=1 FL=1
MIKIICVGKIKEKFYKDAILEYEKRLSKYTNLEIIECPDYDNLPIEIIKKNEKDQILKKIKEKDYIVTMEIDGESLDSPGFSKFIDTTLINNSNITFIIGGSYGLHDDIKKMSNYSLSFSKLTYPHQLFRVILLEQIYRAFKIMKNESYHK